MEIYRYEDDTPLCFEFQSVWMVRESIEESRRDRREERGKTVGNEVKDMYIQTTPELTFCLVVFLSLSQSPNGFLRFTGREDARGCFSTVLLTILPPLPKDDRDFFMIWIGGLGKR